MKHEFPVDGAIDVYAEFSSGALTLATVPADSAAEPAGPARVEVEVEGKTAEQVVVDLHDGTLRVVSPHRTGFLSADHALTVSVVVPVGSRLVTRLGAADVTSRGRLLRAAVKTASGEVELEHVAGDCVVKTGSGAIRVHTVDGEADLKTGSGSITVDRLGGVARLASGSGDIMVDRTDGPAHLKTGSGDILVRHATDETRLASGSGSLEVARVARGRVHLANATGDIRLGVPVGLPVWTDVTSTTGQVHSGLAPTGAPAQGQDHVEVHARTVTGHVYLENV